jgi:hypothetical protein
MNYSVLLMDVLGICEDIPHFPFCANSIQIYFLLCLSELIFNDCSSAGRPRGRSSSPGKSKSFSSPRRPDRFWVPSTSFQWVPGTLSTALKRPGN